MIGRILGGLLLALAAGASPAAGLEGKAAPAIELLDAGGAPRTLAAIVAERPAVVVFWASWCPYCQALLPELAALAEAYGGRVEIVAVNVFEEKQADARAYMAAHEYPFAWLMKGTKASKAWKVKGTPGLYLVGRGGVVRYDRAARPFRAGSEPGPTIGPGSAARSARRWLADLRAEIEAELAR